MEIDLNKNTRTKGKIQILMGNKWENKSEAENEGKHKSSATKLDLLD